MANDTGPQSWRRNRDWWGCWPTEDHTSFLERVFSLLYPGAAMQEEKPRAARSPASSREAWTCILYEFSPSLKVGSKKIKIKQNTVWVKHTCPQANSAHEPPFSDSWTRYFARFPPAPPTRPLLQGTLSPSVLSTTVCLHGILGSLINIPNWFSCADVSCVLK